MPEISFSSLRDKALDVDSDLRFMALEDFKRILNDQNKVNIENFIPYLYKLLEDTNPDVKSQAIKTFPSILPYISNDKRFEIVSKLFNNIIRDVDASSDGFTSSVSNLVLKAIFNSSFKFSNKLSRSILVLMLPHLVDKDLNVDLMEILIDLIKNFSQFLELTEFLKLVNFLINLSFVKINNSISKKSVQAIDVLLQNSSSAKRNVDDEIFDSFLINISTNFDKSSKNFRFINNRLSLISVLVKNTPSLNLTLPLSIVQEIFSLVNSYLDVEIDEDFDFDKILEDNVVKENSLSILIDLIGVSSFETFEPSLNKTKDIILKFEKYDPTSNDDEDDDDFDEDEDDDIEFSDDDELETEFNSDADDGSWKLRLKAVVIIKTLISSYPSLLEFTYNNFFTLLVSKISDKNEFIFKSSIDTLNSIVSVTDENDFKQTYLDQIEAQIISNLTNESAMSFIKLTDSLLNQRKVSFSSSFYSTSFNFFLNNPKNFELVEILSIINSLLSRVELSSLPTEVISGLIQKLCSLLDMNSNIVVECLKIFNNLFRKPDVQSISGIGLVIDALTRKFNDAKLLIDIKIEVIHTVCEYSYFIPLTDDQFHRVVDLLLTSVNLELLLRYALAGLNDKILVSSSANYNLFSTSDFSDRISPTIFLSLDSSNKVIYGLALNTINQLNTPVAYDKLLNFAISEAYNDVRLLNVIFTICENKIDNSILVSEEFQIRLIELLNKIEDDESVEANAKIDTLIFKISANPDSFELFRSRLNLHKTLSVRILAVLTLKLGLVDQIESNERELGDLIQHQSYNDEFKRIVQYLSFIGTEYTLNTLKIDDLVGLLRVDVDEDTKLTISRAVGLLSKVDPKYLIANFKDKDLRPYLLVSIKEFLKHFAEPEINEAFWRILVDEVNVSHISKEFQLVGQSLSIILFKEESRLTEVKTLLNLEEPSIGLVFTLLIIVNQIINNTYDDQLITELVGSSMKYLDLINIDIKILIVKNLINLIHNHSSIVINDLDAIMPKLFEQLKTFDEFKKIIPMGPYKYVIDEGLEIRKLIFELIYSIINNDAVTVDYDYFINELIVRGLTDNEFDIINLSYINLITLIQSNPDFLANAEAVELLVTNLTKNLNKKLKAKATTQEIDVFNESLKNLINLSNVVNSSLIKHNWSHDVWDDYYKKAKEHNP